jgi:SAM-dependent methyltransferase
MCRSRPRRDGGRHPITEPDRAEEADMGTAEIQGALWGAAPDDWAEYNEPTGEPLYEAAYDALSVTASTNLLDAGCGSGYALLLAAKRGAMVSGLDASDGLLEVARRRVPEADLRRGELESLPYDDDTFDVVTAFNSVQYTAAPTVALSEIRRVAKPGAAVAVATWGDPERCEARALIGALGALLPPPPPGAGGPFALAAPGALEALVESASLSAERTIDVPAPFVFADHETATRASLSSGPARAAINRVGEAAVRRAAAAALEQFVKADGEVRLDNEFRVVVARA